MATRQIMPDKLEGTISRIGLAIAAVVGCFSIVGVAVIKVAMLLLLIGLGASLFEIKNQAVRFGWSPVKRWAWNVALIGLFAYCAWQAWFVFAVSMKIRFISGGPTDVHGRQEELLNFAVQLTNKGKPTGLNEWKAYLTLPDGSKTEGQANTLFGDSVEIEGADRRKVSYSIPECDLAFETAAALQTGDTKYGIISFVFDIPPVTVPPTAIIQLRATDMLDRYIYSQEWLFADTNKLPPDRFPCRQQIKQ